MFVARGFGVAAIYILSAAAASVASPLGGRLCRTRADRPRFERAAQRCADPRLAGATVRRDATIAPIALLAACLRRSPAAAASTTADRRASRPSSAVADAAGRQRRSSASRCSRPRTPRACPAPTRSPTPPAWRSPCFRRRSPGTHPTAVTLAPTDDWQAAIAASVLMAPPIRAPILLSGSAVAAGGHRRRAEPARPDRLRARRRGPGDPRRRRPRRQGPALRRDHRATIRTRSRPRSTGSPAPPRGKPSPDVVIASADDPAYAMPAAGWAAESGNPVLFVAASGVPAATTQALLSHQSPHIYVLGPPSVIPDSVLTPAAASTGRSSGSAAAIRRRTRWRSPSTAIRRASSTSPAPTSRAASAGRCAAPATATC